jgi:class 3 adenylate cyclase
MVLQPPETGFASVGNGRVAYQVLGDGPRDLVHTLGLWSQVDVIFEDPSALRYLRRLASFSRVILFDARGTGLSDPRPADGRSIAEHWGEDLLAVLDAVGSRAPTLLGMTDAGPLLLCFLARHPERCSKLILLNTTASFMTAPDYPIGFSPEQLERFLAFFRMVWGQTGWQDFFLPSLSSNEPLRRWVTKWCRIQAPPATAVANVREVIGTDGRPALPGLRVPTLVMTRSGYQMLPLPHGRYLAEHIPGARFVELAGADGLPIWETADEILDRIEEFVTGTRRGGAAERLLTTILFTDIVDSTVRAAALGDRAWRQLLDRHDRAVRELVDVHRGRLVETCGVGTLATFDSPDQAVDCALALHRALCELELGIRTGLHVGSVELRDDGRVSGLAVHIGARVAAAARKGEVLASRTLRDVLIGSRYGFAERGSHELKGVPGTWSLYAVSAPAAAGSSGGAYD